MCIVHEEILSKTNADTGIRYGLSRFPRNTVICLFVDVLHPNNI